MPNRNKMPNQLLHIPMPQTLSPRLTMQQARLKKLAQKTRAQRLKGAKPRPNSRSKRKSPSPPPARLRIKTQSSSDESDVTKSAVKLLPQLTKKEPLPVRSYKAVTTNKAYPTIAGTRKPRVNHPSTYPGHRRDATPWKRHADITSPFVEKFPQPACHYKSQRKCPANYIHTTSINRNDVSLANVQDAPHSNVVCKNMPPIKPTAVTNTRLQELEHGLLHSRDNDELHERTGDKMPLQASSQGRVAQNLNTGGEYSKICSRSPQHPKAAAQCSELSLKSQSNHPRRTADLRCPSNSVSRTSLISDFGGRNFTSGGAASSGIATRTTCVTLFLVTAAVLSFLTFYAITDAILSDHVPTDYRGDPMTVGPNVERELEYPSKLGVYKHGAFLEGKNDRHSSMTIWSDYTTSSHGNSSDNENITDAFEYTLKANN
ncbi:hypothetical protein HPB51_008148 [Rhipicephalus microplus]|uniref:Uncharacterized protein n=1 Tax=Rhipicephalus microplus TaxID=6941 RepID=A0A9J6D4I8_RHIMP|nr:hypothetical protein HPB51_008148 [Rhipicephalus microplus]